MRVIDANREPRRRGRSRKGWNVRKTDREAGRHVGALAREFGLNPRTIRYYERIGLLAASTRTAAGYRVYGP
ncbi:MAG: MerR family DNA-binding transcriptional regulator, partial [Acidobacteria bacterium]|nr:MerR family DNA-binding transcriptional regulator [Acidobacteriota bacterium]